MNRFEVGKTYGVLHLADQDESVTIASRTAKTVHLSDGRTMNVMPDFAADGGNEEVIWIGGSIVRVCNLRAAAQVQA